MSNIFDKLGVLLRSKVGGLTDDIGSSVGTGVSKNQVDKLRKQVNSAVEYEESIQKQILTLTDEITDLNQQIDHAIEQGKDANARHLIATLQRREQHLTLLQGDLETHQLMLNELILQVNQLDAVVSEQKPPQTSSTDAPVASTDRLQDRVTKFQQVIDESQARINELGEKIKSKNAPVTPKPTAKANHSHDDSVEEVGEVEDELEQRRNRLMKR